MTPFVTQVAGCACPRCIAYATPIVPPVATPIVPPAATPVVPPVGGGPTQPPIGVVPDPVELAPHEFWDRTTAPPALAGDQVGAVPQTVVPPMGTLADEVAAPVAAAATPPRDVPLVPVGTPLATVVGLPDNPFLD